MLKEISLYKNESVISPVTLCLSLCACHHKSPCFGNKETVSFIFRHSWMLDLSSMVSLQPCANSCRRPQVLRFDLTPVKSFERVKTLLKQSPAVGLPNYDPFLFVIHMAAVITKEHGCENRPISYFSKRLV